MKTAFFETGKEEETFFGRKLSKARFFREALQEKHLNTISDAEILCIFVHSLIDKNMLDKLPALKAIVTRSTGYDHIDITECKKRTIAVYNVPHYGDSTVAEHAFSLILALSRKIIPSYERTKTGNFSYKGLQGFELQGKTIGIIGLGKIGKKVAEIAQGFEMKVIAHDIFPDKVYAQKKKIHYVSLQELLKKSDIATLHCNLTQKNRHLIDGKKLRLMKKTSLIINTARGGLVDTHALVKALQKKAIRGAGLDVLDEEYSCVNGKEKQLLARLTQFENVIVTPHNAFNSDEACRRMLQITLENIHSAHHAKKGDNRVI